MTNKKFIALLIAICLCASALPIMVLAKTVPNPTIDYEPYAEYPDSVNAGSPIALKFVLNNSYNTFSGWYVKKADGAAFGIDSTQSTYEKDFTGNIEHYYLLSNSALFDFTSTVAMNSKTVYGVYTVPGSGERVLEFDLTVINPSNPGATPNGMKLEGPYIYDEDLDVMMTPKEADGTYEYGENVYYLLIDEVSTVKGPMSNRDYVEKLKAKVKGWQEGGSLVEGAEIIKRRVNLGELLDGNMYHCGAVIDSYGLESGFYYFLKLDIGENNKLTDTDVIGVVEFNRKADNKKGIGKIDESSHDIEFTVFYDNSWLFNTPMIVSDTADLEWDTVYALKFDNDDEVELSFGSPNGGNNEGTFEVDISGQGKLLLSYSTEAVEEIAAANEGAVMNFLLFNNAKFNRSGTFTYEMENGAHAYRIFDGKLIELPGCYDEGEDAFVFNTNILQHYVFADRELVNPA